MIIQKTKNEPISTHTIIQQTAAGINHHQQQHSQNNIATMSGLKTSTGVSVKNSTGGTTGKAGGKGASSAKNHAGGASGGGAGQSSTNTKPGSRMVMHTQDLFKKHHNQVFSGVVDQSPYLQFGVVQHHHHHHGGDSGMKHHRNSHAAGGAATSKTQQLKGGGTTTSVKRNFMMDKQSSASAAVASTSQTGVGAVGKEASGASKEVGMGIYSKNSAAGAHQSSSVVGGGKSSTVGRHPPHQSKDSISSMIQ